MKFTSENAAQFGRKGGRATAEKHGRSHLSKIGRKGFDATTERHFGGDEAKHKAYMAELGAYNYWKQTGMRMKVYHDGKPVWRKPTHPSLTNGIPF